MKSSLALTSKPGPEPHTPSAHPDYAFVTAVPLLSNNLHASLIPWVSLMLMFPLSRCSCTTCSNRSRRTRRWRTSSSSPMLTPWWVGEGFSSLPPLTWSPFPLFLFTLFFLLHAQIHTYDDLVIEKFASDPRLPFPADLDSKTNTFAMKCWVVFLFLFNI